MTRSRCSVVMGLWLLGMACWCTAASAAPPWRGLDLFKRIEADPNESYPITDSNGPWMIMAVTFSGSQAEEQARELVYELRSRFKLNAYTHEVTFDHTKGAGPVGVDRYGQPKKVNYRYNELTEIAVLIGDFSTIDDPQAQKTLDKVKYLHPECLDLQRRVEEGRPDNRTLAGLRLMQQAFGRSDENRQKGPMGHAFVTANPLLPSEYFQPKGIDPLVLEMNKAVKHSLLDCPGNYTVQVATFTGRVVYDQEAIRELERGKDMPSMLAKAADKAHRLTLALREKGYDAYEFHDRYSSIVTVGGFAAVGTPRRDGKIEINPDVLKIMDTFGAEKNLAPGQAAPQVGQPKTITVQGEKGPEKIVLDVQPIPVEAPRRSIAVDYNRPFFTRN